MRPSTRRRRVQNESQARMSLKGKIEAVIYAAEEPVTLAQLVSLLGLEGQAELDRARAAQQMLPLAGEDEEGSEIPLPSEPDQLNEEVLTAEAELESAEGTEGGGESEAGPEGAEKLARVAEAVPETAADGGTEPVRIAEEKFQAADALPAATDGEAATGGPMAAETAAPDEKQLAREAKERERALREYFRRVLEELMRDYALGDRGLEIREVANGFRMATKPETHDAVRGFAKSLKPPLKLSLQALETLAVVAYKQPVTAPEVSEIRGVDSGGVLGSLLARKLVTTAGRKQVIGRPILYKLQKTSCCGLG